MLKKYVTYVPVNIFVETTAVRNLSIEIRLIANKLIDAQVLKRTLAHIIH
jgi:hypothetical protein